MKLLNTKEGYVTLLMGKPYDSKTKALLMDACECFSTKERTYYFSYEFFGWTLNRMIENNLHDKDDDRENLLEISSILMPYKTIIDVIKFNKPEVVYIDFLNCLIFEGDDQYRAKLKIEIVNAFINLAKELDIKIILADALPRSSVKEEIENSLEALSNITNKERIIPMLLLRDDYESKDVNIYEIKDNTTIPYSSFNLDKFNHKEYMK